MKKQFYLVLITAIAGLYAQTSHAQVQVHPLTGQTVTGPIITTIQEIQSVAGSRLASCDDQSSFATLTVIVRGRMVMGGQTTFPAFTDAKGTTYPQTTTSTAVNQFGRDLVMQSGTGPFSGLVIRSGSCGPVLGSDMLEATAGDSVEVEGVIEDNTGNGFGGNTQINPIKFTVLDRVSTNLPALIDGQQIEGFAPVLVNLSDLNTGGSAIINKLETGEQYENMFVEIRDLTVVEYSVTSGTINDPDYSSTSLRIRITCSDNNGNYIQIYDRFKAGRLPKNIQSSTSCNAIVSQGGTLGTIPPIGGKYNSVKGILINIKNQVPGQVCPNVVFSNGLPANDKGYQLEPFYPSHYDIAPYNPPFISDVKVSPVAPAPSESPTISATIQTVDPNISISNATLFYGTDTLNLPFKDNVNMVSVGSTWSAEIPSIGFTEGKLVYFYIKASDSRSPSLDKYYPSIPVTINGIATGKDKPAFYVVRENGLQIKDVQYTPFLNGISGFTGRIVTLTGVATSTVNDLGRVTIQQEGASDWGGIFLEDNIFLSEVKRGDKITVEGKVAEIKGGSSSTFTVLKDLTLTSKVQPSASGIRITPLFIDHTILAGNYSFKKHEKYEGMLATIINPVQNGKLFVVDSNADYMANFSEYRIGTDTLALLQLPSTITSAVRNVSIVGTRVLTGRTPSENAISSQVFPLIANPVQLLTSSGSNLPPDTIVMKARFVNPVIANRKVSFDNITGVIQNSFGNMKLLPRDVFDIKGLKVNGVDAVTTLPGFTAGVPSLLGNADVYVFPNPVEGLLNIKVLSATSVSASFYDLLGSEALAPQSFTGDGQLDVSALAKGIYLLKLTGKEGNTLVKRIVVQ